MRILITSGGTRVPIDPVRDIRNMSKGTFGSKIAKEALNQGHEVCYLISEGGETPLKISFDANDAASVGTGEQFYRFIRWCNDNSDRYTEFSYRTYEDYASELERLVREWHPEVVILAAAVSDYITDPHDEKIRSSEQLTIQLRPAEKIISKVKLWKPDVSLVGFKLLVGATDKELIEAAWKSIETNGCDVVVANDLNSLRAGNHKLLIVEPRTFDNSQPHPEIFRYSKETSENLAAEVVLHATGDRSEQDA